MSTAERVRQLHDHAVADLIHAHSRRTDEPLVLAVRFDLADSQDIHVLEVLDGFPGGEEDELLVTEFWAFGPAANSWQAASHAG